MSEYQGRKRGLVPEDGERSHCGKKTRSEQGMAPGPGGRVMQEGEASQGSSDGEASRGSSDGEGIRAAIEAIAMEEAPTIKVTIRVSLLHCQACIHPLKPPTFKHGRACGRAANYAACRELDAFLLDTKVPCENVEFGCESEVVYYQATEHHGACRWAPCFCPDFGYCGFFSSPARLVEHFRDQHHWPVTEVSYGSPCKLPVPAPPRGCHVLVGSEDLFLVSSGALGAAATAVSLVCVKANGAAAPLFKCALSVSVEFPSNRDELILTMSVVRSSDLSGGFPSPDENLFLAVPHVLLHDAPGEAPGLMVCIDKADADTVPANSIAPPASATNVKH
ncbi:hypothetical protein BS78_03G082600 [Paspalum vaginatum]|nr:hypothetical protein BS78_03G082600 [Paspalum vaginatum]